MSNKEYTIGGKLIVFKPHRFCKSRTCQTYLSEDGLLVLKHIRRYQEYDIYEREVYILRHLLAQGIDWCPRIVASDDNNQDIIMSYSGDCIKRGNKPPDWREQVERIIDDMNRMTLVHGDLTKKEVLVDDKGKIHVVDFGWSMLNGSYTMGACLWNGDFPGERVTENTELLDIVIGI